MMKNVNWYDANYKDWVGVSAAPVFWVASLVCFVFGLSFKQGTGIVIPGTTMDLAILFSIGLGLANTAIQIVGNDTEKEDLGMALFLMWGASYALGIGSNVNFLYSIIGLTHPFLQFMVCWGLGIMIEVAPERLLVRWLRGVGILKSSNSAQKPQQSNTVSNQQNARKEPPQSLPRQQQAPVQANKGNQHSSENLNYHPVNYQPRESQYNYEQLMNEAEQEVPGFLQKRHDNGKVQG